MRRVFSALAALALLSTAAPSAATQAPAYDDPPPILITATPPVQTEGPCAMSDRRSEVDAVLRASMGTATPGVALVVLCGGALVYHDGFGRMRLDRTNRFHFGSVFRLASVTKTMTAAVVLKLAEQGELSIQDPLSRHLPDFPGAEDITLYQLLTHTSGLADFTEDATYEAHKARDHSTAEMVAWIASLEPRTRFEPGEGWAYSNSGYVLLGAVVEKVTGKPLQAAYDELLFRPLRRRSMAFDFPGGPRLGEMQERVLGYRRDKTSSTGFAPAAPISMTLPGAAGSLRATAFDTARFADVLFRGGYLQPESLARMTSPGLLNDGRPDRWGMPKEWREGLQADYGLGLFIDERTGRRRWWHAGDVDGFHSWLAYFPDEQVTIVLLRNSESGDPMHEDIQAAVFKALAR